MKKYQYLIFSLLIFGLGFWMGSLYTQSKNTEKPIISISEYSHKGSVSEQYELNAQEVPEKVLVVLEYIRENDKAPKGYVGGRTFYNREGLLPKNVSYREWDVNPKKKGKNRGAERLVTSKDAAYYTNDHYESFILIKEK